MTNKEKIEEVFGVTITDSEAHTIGCALFPNEECNKYYCEECPVRDWAKEEYKEDDNE